jgi:tetratricopeptide (TPR) repeat protein
MSPARAARVLTGGFFLLATTFGAGCAALQTERLLASATAFPQALELHDVPFFPQEDYQCGPAALATVLSYSGVAVSPEQLTPQVYVPERRGSFQVELLAAARRHERVPYMLAPQLESLAAELASGNPVLVLQNLALAIAPTWHYAVVVGLDLTRGEIVLRSGRERRHVLALATFEHTWRRGDYWAAVVLPPQQLPFTALEQPYLESVLALEKTGRLETAALAYASAAARWPQSLPALMGLGNTRHALGDLAAAERAFRRAVSFHPAAAAAHNNLAQTLADQGRYDEAETAARRALELEGAGRMREQVQQTLDGILRRGANGEEQNTEQ